MPFEITIDVEDADEAERIYDSVEKLLFDMGQIGTLSMRGVKHINIEDKD